MYTEQLQSWLRSVLADERRRKALRSLLDQYELPVIQVGWQNRRTNRKQISRVRSRSQIFSYVKRP